MSAADTTSQRATQPDIPQRILQAKLNAMWDARNRGDTERAQQLWREFTEAVSQRSPERIKQMEREQRIS